MEFNDIIIPSIQSIKKLISQGVDYREKGDYKNGEIYLKETYILCKNINYNKLIVECGNHLSIQYRLIAARMIRRGFDKKAMEYSIKSLNIFKELKELELIDIKNTSYIRNYSHALLYAGFIDQAIIELKKSIELQNDIALKADEICHLASSLLDEKNTDIKKALELVNEGIKLLEQNQVNAIALTYGYLTRSTIFAKKGLVKKSTEDLKKALKIAISNKLEVRKEEITFLQNKNPKDVNILDAVIGNLRNKRRSMIYK